MKPILVNCSRAVLEQLERLVYRTGMSEQELMDLAVNDSILYLGRFHPHGCNLMAGFAAEHPESFCNHCSTLDGQMGECVVCGEYVSLKKMECACACHRFLDAAWPY
jgi:hypothetical protein